MLIKAENQTFGKRCSLPGALVRSRLNTMLPTTRLPAPGSSPGRTERSRSTRGRERKSLKRQDLFLSEPGEDRLRSLTGPP